MPKSAESADRSSQVGTQACFNHLLLKEEIVLVNEDRDASFWQCALSVAVNGGRSEVGPRAGMRRLGTPALT